jgi:hypothetical protein
MPVCHEHKMEAIQTEKLLGSCRLYLFFFSIRIYIENIVFASGLTKQPTNSLNHSFHGAESFFRRKWFPIFSGTWGVLPFLQQSSTCPYTEPYQSGPCLSIPCVYDCLNILLLSTPRLSRWLFYVRFFHQNLACTSFLPHTCHMPHPSHSCFHHPGSYKSCSFLQSCVYSCFLSPNSLLSTLFLKTLSLCSSHNV